MLYPACENCETSTYSTRQLPPGRELARAGDLTSYHRPGRPDPPHVGTTGGTDGLYSIGL
eukprot:2482664-Pleurochrysis_carterae.AAC.1